MIPTYNSDQYLAESLGSVLAQDPGPAQMQIEVVDDHSTIGDTEAVVRDLGGDRVGYFRQSRNVGPHANFDTCFRRAYGNTVHLLNADDWVRSGFYEHLEAGLRSHPEVGAAFTRHIYCDSEGHWQTISPLERRTAGIVDDWLKRIASGQRIATPSMVIRRSTLEAVGGFDARGRMGEDWELWVRIATRVPVWFDPEPLAVYRVYRPGSLTGSADRLQLARDMFEYTNIVESYLFDHLPPDDAHAALKRARAMYARWAVEAALELSKAGRIRRSLEAAGLALREGPTVIMLGRLAAAFAWSGWVSMRRRQTL
jgi:glycosyltransferase involved in cell wall biosynthesis